METGEIIKSALFNTPRYWAIQCDNTDLPGNRNGVLPIDPLSTGRIEMGRRVEFEVVEIGNDESMKYYARITN
jgi:hypothetical protein